MTTGTPLTAAPGLQRSSVWIAMFVVYVVWATSYFAIKAALTAFPPLLMCGLRSLLAGALLLALLLARRHWRGGMIPTPAQWRDGSIIGLLAITVGSSLLAFGMRDADPGSAAVLYAAMPILACLLVAAIDRRIARLQWVGAALGLVGIAVLNLDALPALLAGAHRTGDAVQAGAAHGNLLVLASAGCTALTAVGISRLRMPADPLWAACIQLLAGGAGATVLGFLTGERLGPPAATGLLAFVYLAVAASVCGYVAYNHLNQQAGPAVAVSYAYVNPPVALALDAVLFGTRPTGQALLATLLVMGGVSLTLRSTRTERSLPPPVLR